MSTKTVLVCDGCALEVVGAERPSEWGQLTIADEVSDLCPTCCGQLTNPRDAGSPSCTGRARCSVCNRLVSVTRTGLLVSHGYRRGDPGSTPCSGSGSVVVAAAVAPPIKRRRVRALQKIGTCPVCKTTKSLTLSTELIMVHGPMGARCPGSLQRPVPGSVPLRPGDVP